MWLYLSIGYDWTGEPTIGLTKGTKLNKRNKTNKRTNNKAETTKNANKAAL